MLFGVNKSAIFAEETLINTEHLKLYMKFQNLSRNELEWLWEKIVSEFLLDSKDEYFWDILCNDKNLKPKYIENLSEFCENNEGDIMVDGIYRDSRYERIRSYSGVLRYFNKRYDELEDIDFEKDDPTYIFWPRRRYATDEKFLEAACKTLERAGKEVKEIIVFPDLDWNFVYYKSETKNTYDARLTWNIAGYVVDYDYENLIEQLQIFLREIDETITESLMLLYTSAALTSRGEPPFAELLYNDLFEAYGKDPVELFLLGSIEWLNYVPYSILKKEQNLVSDEETDVKKGKNGVWFQMKKPIRKVTVEDQRHMRKKYLDTYLMKARGALSEEVYRESRLRGCGENYPIYRDEIKVLVTQINDTDVMYGLEYVPLELKS